MSYQTALSKSFCEDLINNKFFDDAVNLVKDIYKLEVEASQSKKKFIIKANVLKLLDLVEKLLESWFERKKKNKGDSINERITATKENPLLDIADSHVIWIFWGELASKLASNTYKKDREKLKFISPAVNVDCDKKSERVSIWCNFGDFEAVRNKVDSLKIQVTNGNSGQPSDKSQKSGSNDTSQIHPGTGGSEGKGQSLSGKSKKSASINTGQIDPATGGSNGKGSQDRKKGEITATDEKGSSQCNLEGPGNTKLDKSETSNPNYKDSKPNPSSQLEGGSKEQKLLLHSDKSKKPDSKDTSQIGPSTGGSKGEGNQDSKKGKMTATDDEGTSQFNLTAPQNTNLNKSETLNANGSSQAPHSLVSEDERSEMDKWLLFCTPSGKTKVFVYKASIVSLPGIDAIVNAANEHLSHAGGVAYHISKAAGGEKSKLEKQCQSYIKKNGNIAVTKNFTSSAGDMLYKGVIHAVGPMWSGYKAKKECEEALYMTIINVLVEADTRKFSKIALPAISSGIYGVPKRVCAEMYIRGVIDYDRRYPQTKVREIHFVDISTDILQEIRDAYGRWKQNDKSLDVKNASSYSSTSGRNGSTGQVSSASQNQMDDWEIPSFQLAKDTFVRVYKCSIVEVRNVDAIACAVNKDFSIDKRKVANLIRKQAGYTYEMEFKKKTSEFGPKSREDVLICGAGKLSETQQIRYVIHITLGKIEEIEDMHKIKHLYIQAFETARKENMLKIALPLIGAANLKDASDADIQLCSRLFVKTLKEVVKERGKNMTVQEIHLVDLNDKIIGYVVKAFQEQDTADHEMPDQKGGLFRKSILNKTPGKHEKGSRAPRSGNGEKSPTTVREIGPESSVRNRQTSQADNKCSYECGRPGTKKKYPDCSHVLCNTCFTPSLESGCPFCKSIADEKKKKMQNKGKESERKSNIESEETKNCPVCMDVLTNPMSLPCGHDFHADCIKESLQHQPACPICGTVMKETTKEKASNDGSNTQSVEIENCPICMDVLTKPKRLPCGHNFHADCIKQSLEYKPVCPICGTVMGQLNGNQPEGTMSFNVQNFSLPGYEDCNTFEIFYNIPDGLQQDIHPHPGNPYTGTRRKAFLPNNSEGKKVLKLLKLAFDRKLVFTIGESRTTGKTDIVTWNDIHHKTKRDGGPTNFGYPDKTYLSRVQEELAAKGVTEKDIEDIPDCQIS